MVLGTRKSLSYQDSNLVKLSWEIDDDDDDGGGDDHGDDASPSGVMLVLRRLTIESSAEN